MAASGGGGGEHEPEDGDSVIQCGDDSRGGVVVGGGDENVTGCVTNVSVGLVGVMVIVVADSNCNIFWKHCRKIHTAC